MKKIFILTALFAVFAAVGVEAQKYSMSSKVDVPVEGTEYVLYNTSRATFAGSTTDGCTTQIVDDNNLWTFEKTGETVDGYDVWRMKNVGNGQYWQDANFENYQGYAGYDVYGYIGCNAAWGAAATAEKFTICVADDSDTRSTGATNDGLVLMRMNTVDQGDGTIYSYKLSTVYYGDVCNVAFAPWGVANVWQLWTVTENSSQDKLQILVDDITSADKQFEVGTDPGYYTQDADDAFREKFTEAQDALASSSVLDSQYETLFNELNEAYEAAQNAMNPVVAGYYYIVSGYELFYDCQGVEMAMYGYDEDEPCWGTFDPEEGAFLWQVTEKNDGWAVYNVLYAAYLHGSTYNYYGQDVAMASSTSRTTYFSAHGDSQWEIYNSFCDFSYQPNNHGYGVNTGGNIITRQEEGDIISGWYLRTVTDQTFIDAVIATQAQNELNDELTALVKEAGSIYNEILIVDCDEEHPYITKADDAATGTEGNQFLYNRKEASEGCYACLIDEDTGYYTDEGEAYTYFHGCWEELERYGAHSDDDVDFMQVDLQRTDVSEFALKYAQRYDYSDAAYPTRMSVYASNDTTGYYVGEDSDWTKITTLYPTSISNGEYWISPIIDMGATYRYIRFYVEATNNGSRYITPSEFQLYPATYDEENSQYFQTTGMKEAADQMEADRGTASEALDNNAATQELIDQLSADITAVRAFFADQSELNSLLSAAATYFAYAEVGDAIGNIASQDVYDTYAEAYAKAENATLSVSIINELKAAQDAFLENMVVPTSDKWYFITCQDESSRVDFYSRSISALGSPIYVSGVTEGSTIHWYHDYGEELDGSAVAMWRVIPVEGAETPHTVYIQNMASGLYMGNVGATAFSAVTLSAEPVPYVITFVGWDDVALVPAENNSYNYSLNTNALNYYITGGNWVVGGASNRASLWTFREVDAELEGVILPVSAGENVCTLPFGTYDLDLINDVATYGVASINGEEVNLYTKTEFSAGEPFIMTVNETPEDGATTVDIFVPTPTVDDMTSTAGKANGLVGALSSTVVPAGAGYVNADGEWVAATEEEEVTVTAQTGYINPSAVTTLNAEVVKTLTISGLYATASSGDVNGDGEVTAADAVSVYNYVTNGEDSGVTGADVNGDGVVNSADAVTVYNYITHGS